MQEAFLILNAAFFSVICLVANSNSVRLSWVLGSEWPTRNALFATYSIACIFSTVVLLLPYPLYLTSLLTFNAAVVLIIPVGYRFRVRGLSGNKA